MSWSINWQQDLSPVHHDSSSSHLYVPQRSMADLNESSFFDEQFPLATLEAKLEDCRAQYANETLAVAEDHPEGFCKVSFDSILCWPPTPFNVTVTVQCFSEFNNMKYDATKNITRTCSSNGTWHQAHYLNCEYFPEDDEFYNKNNEIYYFVGYTLSLIALTIAIFVFTHFKELRCLRNTIHLNLMWSHLLTHCMWILSLLLLKHGMNSSIVCLFDITLLHYFYVTTFFWMFVEGLYLYILVVKTLSRESFKLRVYVCVGWGLPFLIVLTWAVTKTFISFTNEPYYITCQWFEYHNIDWIYLTPTLLVLLLNLLFLFSIMCVLIMKLRSAPTLETKQYHKATRALLVLIPLLGITYVITIYTPSQETPTTFIFECFRAVLLSTQGFVVALFYCFLNSEVQNTLKHHFDNWKASRMLGSGRFRSSSKTRIDMSRRHTEWTLVQSDDAQSNGHPRMSEGDNGHQLLILE